MATPSGHLDVPAPGELCDPLCFRLEGWVNPGTGPGEVAAVEAWIGTQCVGVTGLLYERPDVTGAAGLRTGTRTGFRMVGVIQSATILDRAVIDLRLRLHGEDERPVVASTEITFIPRDYRAADFGILLRPETVEIMRREHMYTSGRSLAEGSPEVLGLLRQYLPAPPSRVVDLGCGLGYYGRQLRPLGYDWVGAEMKDADCAELARQGLPFQKFDGHTLPFPDNTFDAAMCLERLAHVEDPRAFLAEVRRVAPRRLVVSVPNAEIIPYLGDQLAARDRAPEDDAKILFTRWSLAALLDEFYSRAEVLLHTRHPRTTTEGTPLFSHLLAVAWVDDPSLG